MNKDIRIALTGFMGVGKSSVARHLAQFTRAERIDLDDYIETETQRKIADIIDEDGIDKYRSIETKHLRRLLADNRFRILSLGGGTWTIAANRELLKSHGWTSVWLESTFEHCWLNISRSKKDRPLARNKQKAIQLFDERRKDYCLADWHFIVRRGSNSYEVARQIADEIFE